MNMTLLGGPFVALLLLCALLPLARAVITAGVTNAGVYSTEVLPLPTSTCPTVSTTGNGCQCSWKVGAWKVGLTTTGTISSTNSFYASTKSLGQQNSQPYVAGTQTRIGCCQLCGYANSTAACAYWQHFVPPTALTGCSGSTVTNKCGYCIIYPGSAPTCAQSTSNGFTDYWYSSVGALTTGCAGIAGDPHMRGARGESFDFNGEMGKSFCLLTDRSLHVNALLDGYTDSEGGVHTWMKAMSFLWKDLGGRKHSVVLSARQGKEQKRGLDGFLQSVIVDGAPVPAPTKTGDVLDLDGDFTLTLFDADDVVAGGLEREVYFLSIGDILEAEVHIKPEPLELQTSGDALVHFDFQITKLQNTPHVHGVLGQTYRMGSERVARAYEYSLLSMLLGQPVSADGSSGTGILDGHTQDYRTSDIASADCSFAHAWLD